MIYYLRIYDLLFRRLWAFLDLLQQNADLYGEHRGEENQEEEEGDDIQDDLISLSCVTR